MDSFHGWYDDRYLSKMLYSTIPPHFDDLKGNVMDLEFLCFSVLYLIMSYHCVGIGSLIQFSQSFWVMFDMNKHRILAYVRMEKRVTDVHVWHDLWSVSDLKYNNSCVSSTLYSDVCYRSKNMFSMDSEKTKYVHQNYFCRHGR